MLAEHNEMSIVGGIIVFIILWWLVLFTILPWRAHPCDTPAPGHADGAPEKPHLALKFALTTGIAVVLWFIVYMIAESGWISLRDL